MVPRKYLPFLEEKSREERDRSWGGGASRGRRGGEAGDHWCTELAGFPWIPKKISCRQNWGGCMISQCEVSWI